MSHTCATASCDTITGAIFDCDGTLVDSMPMWNALVEEVFDTHSIPKTPELLAEAEAYNFDDMCFWFHERFGIGASGAALLADIRAQVQDHYRHDIPLFAGCREFLDELHAAGVRMLILSATTEPEVRVALETQGLSSYFERVIQTSETGSDKEHPEAYQYALDALGTDKETTWVFEDAPFAVRTAHEFGLKTVCMYNDHDGRDIDFCRAHSDILAHGYRELSLALLEDFAAPVRDPHGVLRALIVDGSPRPSSAELVAELAGQADYVIAADRGAEVCRKAGVAPHMFCGDADSIDAAALAWVREAAGAQIRYPEEKYATDLALALDCAAHEAARRKSSLELTLTCASGGRPDHALAVVGCLARAAHMRPRLVEDGFVCRILSPEGCGSWKVGEFEGATGCTFSLIPLVEGTVVSERGMRWELAQRRLDAFVDEGVSNVVVDGSAKVTCHEGLAAAYLIR